ncbi:MAG: hypothetical protein PWQ95_2033 [Thermococcaceae archaeon]|nr:hypothetical protein [Thermococcaceae archaeon]
MLTFPHDYVLRKQADNEESNTTQQQSFHTITFYGNPMPTSSYQRFYRCLSTRLRSTETVEFKDFDEAQKIPFHTITFYGNEMTKKALEMMPKSFPHDYVLRKHAIKIVTGHDNVCIFPHDYVLRKPHSRNINANGHLYAFHTITFYGN